MRALAAADLDALPEEGSSNTLAAPLAARLPVPCFIVKSPAYENQGFAAAEDTHTLPRQAKTLSAKLNATKPRVYKGEFMADDKQDFQKPFLRARRTLRQSMARYAR